MAQGEQRLALPDHGVKLKHDAQGDRVWCCVRRRWVALTPEEWVRQHFLNHLVFDLGCPLGLLAVERHLKVGRSDKRADILVHDATARPIALVECKAPSVRITRSAFDQAARYNSVFQVPVLMVTNGLVHYACRVWPAPLRFLPELPGYGNLIEWATTGS